MGNPLTPKNHIGILHERLAHGQPFLIPSTMFSRKEVIRVSPTPDQQLSNKLQKLIDDLSTWREAMCVPGPGCACTAQTLCALRTVSSPHAAVYNQISEAIQQLAHAVEALGRET
jgi:hypothetical protein